MLTVYGLTKCTTCQKAVDELRDLGHEVTFFDVRDDGISDDTLMAALAQVGERKLLNRASYTWRGLTVAEQAGDPLQTLKAHPSLMKRPLIVDGDKITAGWTKATKTALSP